MTRFAWCALVLAACGGSDAKTADAAPPTVMMVTCPATPDAVVTTSGFSFSPETTTIAKGKVVKFMPAIDHDVVPGHVPADSTIADSGLMVSFGATTCLKFTETGMFGFHCMPHGFNGTIVVQ